MVEAQVENAKQQAILMTLKSQVRQMKPTFILIFTLSGGSCGFLMHSAQCQDIILKHAELGGELATLYRKEEKLLSETVPDVCGAIARHIYLASPHPCYTQQFINHLINQLVRHQFLKIACQMEKKTMLGAFSLLKVIESELQGYLSATRGRVAHSLTLNLFQNMDIWETNK
ncbi:hypothetical protein Leryth_025122 [Lithospermum erythrorhizon]|nr:hypothetical protein Leryth_025122 [Lithospermum erythrorhizon]